MKERKTSNTQHPTSNAKWMLAAMVFLAGLTAAVAQNQPQFDPLAQLQVSQPPIEVVSNATATVSFDPPVIRPGGKSTYRVTFNALDDSIRWPRDIIAPPELEIRQSARGQNFMSGGFKLLPFTIINHHVRATKVGSYTIAPFTVEVYGRRVTVPAATLRVTDDPAEKIPWAPTLELQFVETNVYAGQPVSVRIKSGASPDNSLQVLAQPKLTGEGFLVDAGSSRLTIENSNPNEVSRFIYETIMTPLVSGKVTVSAQAFTAGNRIEGGGIVIRGSATIGGGGNVLLDSEPLELNVKPLPRTGQLPGFAGAIGVFTNDPPLLLSKDVQLGDLVKMEVTFRGEGNLGRLVMPPPPQVPGWQIFPADMGTLPLTNRPATAQGNQVRFVFTMIPQTNGLTVTPTIPFSYFDPKRGAYVDLSIPPMPITVREGPVKPDWSGIPETNVVVTATKSLSLSGLASGRGRTANSLRPLQQQTWFVAVQVAPVVGLVGLWAWDRRRRYLEQHPEIVLRRRARRALRRARRGLEQAQRTGNPARYAAAAVNAMQVACAPHYPAEPRALVGRDVLELFAETDRNGRMGEIVRKIFWYADASVFAGTGVEANGLLTLHPEVQGVLARLEAKL